MFFRETPQVAGALAARGCFWLDLLGFFATMVSIRKVRLMILKTLISLAVTLSLLLIRVCGAESLAGAGAPQEVYRAASNGLPVFLGKVPLKSRELYGFTPDTDFSKIQLGPPALLRTIRPATLSSNRTVTAVSAVVSDTTMWFFPVLVEGEAKAMLVVDRHDGEWRAVSLGYAPLAAEWNHVLHQWPAARGFHPALIGVFQANQFYFTIPELGDANLTPLFMPYQSRTPANAAAGPPASRYAVVGESSNEIAGLRSRLAGVRLDQ